MAVAPLGVVAVRHGVAVVGSLPGDVVGFLREGVVGLLRGVAAVAFLVGGALGLRQEAGEGVSLRVGEVVGVIERSCVFSLGENKIFSIDGLFHVFLSCPFFWSTSCILQKRNCFSIIDPRRAWDVDSHGNSNRISHIPYNHTTPPLLPTP